VISRLDSYALWKGREAIVKLLVERDDADANAKDEDGRTALSWAVARG
jgi:ankyrin repeat protein